MSSFKPNQSADQVQAREEVACSFFVARRDASEMFDYIEETLDKISLGIKSKIAFPLDLAIRFGWNDRFDGAHFKAPDEVITVISLVTEERFRSNLADKGFGLRYIMRLAAGETDHEWISKRVDESMDFCRKSAARASYGLILPPFFRAPALC